MSQLRPWHGFVHGPACAGHSGDLGSRPGPRLPGSRSRLRMASAQGCPGRSSPVGPPSPSAHPPGRLLSHALPPRSPLCIIRQPGLGVLQLTGSLLRLPFLPSWVCLPLITPVCFQYPPRLETSGRRGRVPAPPEIRDSF